MTLFDFFLGPDQNELITRITETGPNTFKVEYTPKLPGDLK